MEELKDRDARGGGEFDGGLIGVPDSYRQTFVALFNAWASQYKPDGYGCTVENGEAYFYMWWV